jgi:secreted Zn-dependent insulinase-like peptidase
MVVDAKGGYVSYEELAAALAQRDKLVAALAHLQSFVQGDLQEYDAAEVASLINKALKKCGK